jgi:hypothetical protein
MPYMTKSTPVRIFTQGSSCIRTRMQMNSDARPMLLPWPTGYELLARAQAQEQAVTARLQAKLPTRRGTPVHINFAPEGSPVARDLSRLEMLSVRLRASAAGLA